MVALNLTNRARKDAGPLGGLREQYEEVRGKVGELDNIGNLGSQHRVYRDWWIIFRYRVKREYWKNPILVIIRTKRDFTLFRRNSIRRWWWDLGRWVSRKRSKIVLRKLCRIFWLILKINIFEILISKKTKPKMKLIQKKKTVEKEREKLDTGKHLIKVKIRKLSFFISSISRSSRRSWAWTVRVSRAWAGSTRGALPAG